MSISPHHGNVEHEVGGRMSEIEAVKKDVIRLYVLLGVMCLLVCVALAAANMTLETVLDTLTEVRGQVQSLTPPEEHLSGRLPGDDTPATERCYLTEEERAALPQFETGHLETVTVTFYCNEKYRHICGGGRGIAADGTPAEAWLTCAVDPSVIPLGSTVTVDFGDGQAPLLLRANDTGSGVKGDRIDICVGSHEEALRLGRRTAAVRYVGG